MFGDLFDSLNFGRIIIDKNDERWVSLKHCKDKYHMACKEKDTFPATVFLVEMDEEKTKVEDDKAIEECKRQMEEKKKENESEE